MIRTGLPSLLSAAAALQRAGATPASLQLQQARHLNVHEYQVQKPFQYANLAFPDHARLSK